MAEARPQRKLAAILSADVVGYSRLMGLDEAGTLARLNALRRELINPTIGRHSGRIVKLMGDGALVEFASAVDAVTCAIEIQRQLRERDAGGSEADPIRLRIGINVGDIIIDGDDILGDGVNIAARVEGIAEPGGISISEDAWRQVQGKVAANFVDTGEQSLKNIARPVRVYRLDLVATVAGPSPASRLAAALSDKPAIAVLAFNNMSGDPEQEYFSDGISEDIITDLSKLSELQVIARNSTFSYKGKSVDVKQIGRELGVRYVLEGSVRKAGNRVRVTGQLIDAASGAHIWADRFDRDLTDIFAVQDELTREIIAALKIKLSEGEKALLASGGTKNADAHDLFLKGRELMFGNKLDREAFEQSMSCFRRAAELDPNYAGAYAGLGMGYALDYQNHWSDTPDKSLEQAQRLVDEAIAKDEKDSFAHVVACVVATWTKDYERWAREAERALALNPNYALAHLTKGNLHTYTGEPAKAIACIEQAIRLNPTVALYRHFLGAAYFVAGNYETAAALFKERIAMAPTTDLSRAFLACALGHLGKVDEARQVWRELKEINPKYSFATHIARLPFKYAADAEKFRDGLRKAGLAE
ncbi:MAG TPA: adenylate/guanylate cyclase domain-containing protein [Xanthobacteraceae bacterium]|nr:adenylate/guanylate cyclase domain-containing protein [Xanthobacteraceae bacterium]